MEIAKQGISMSEKITIVEIAKMANVSTATVSRIINNTGTVSQEKRKVVLDLIKKYDYQPNQIAKALQARKSNMIGFVVPHINSPYYAQLFYETEVIAKKHGYTLMLCNSESDKELESNILNEFVSANVRAIVFLGGRLDDMKCGRSYISEIENINKKIPVISCCEIPQLNCVQVFQNTQKSTQLLLRHLADLGIRDVAMLGGDGNIRTTKSRREEIYNSAEQYGIQVRREIIESDYSVAGGNEAMQKLIQQKNLPQAIICINDLVATGALNEAKKNKLSVPKDIAITGYDNLDISQYIYPGITTIACNYSEYGKAIVDAINNIDEIDVNAKISVEADFVVRGTTRL